MSRRYLYNYQTIVGFGEPVVNHAVMLRCQPVRGEYINVEEEHLVMPSGYRMRCGSDAFGNRIVYGGRREEHSVLAYVSTGIVSMSPYAVGPDRIPMPLWLQPSRLTALPDAAAERLCRDIPADADGICRAVNSMIEYAPGTTGVDTTAADVLGCGVEKYGDGGDAACRGVCQDYAHVMIALCRRAGIAARYVCGFLVGTGRTHAWVEVYDDYAWQGYDPTHGGRIEYGYMKIAHGRDASDCPVNRGMYGGVAAQETQVSVTLQEI